MHTFEQINEMKWNVRNIPNVEFSEKGYFSLFLPPQIKIIIALFKKKSTAGYDLNRSL